MTYLIIFSGIAAPAIAWGIFFIYKDRFRPEPLKRIGQAYLMGIITAWLCYYSFNLLPYLGIPGDASAMMDADRFAFFWYCLGVVGLVEEFFKFLPFLFIIYTFRSFDEKIDGIIYSSLIAMGFASYENFHYLALMEGWELVGRAVATPLTHGIFAAVWGYMVGTAKIDKRSVWAASIIGLSLSAIIHGLFDFLATDPTWQAASAGVILAAWGWRILLVEKLNKQYQNSKESSQWNWKKTIRDLITENSNPNSGLHRISHTPTPTTD